MVTFLKLVLFKCRSKTVTMKLYKFRLQVFNKRGKPKVYRKKLKTQRVTVTYAHAWIS